jgi:hypothetical protein
MSHHLPRKLLLGFAVAAALLPTAASAQAASCSFTSAAPLFSPWNDPAPYVPFQGSSFENGASGWSWGGKANIVKGDGNVALTAGTHAANIPGSGTAKSPWLCVNATTPSLRFFIRRISGTGNLHVQGVLNGPAGKVSSIITTMSADSTWKPSPIVAFPLAFMAALSAGDLQAQFLFVADAGTVFRIDDIHLDPFKRV